MKPVYRALWTLGIGWPGAITIADALGYETDTALRASLTNSGLDMFEWSAGLLQWPRHRFALLVGVLQFAAAVCIATGWRERSALKVVMLHQTWMALVCFLMSKQISPGELMRHPAASQSALAKELWVSKSSGEIKVTQTSNLGHVFIALLTLWRHANVGRTSGVPGATKEENKAH